MYIYFEWSGMRLLPGMRDMPAAGDRARACMLISNSSHGSGTELTQPRNGARLVAGVGAPFRSAFTRARQRKRASYANDRIADKARASHTGERRFRAEQ